MAKLIARYQNQTLGEFPLKAGINTIGRLPDCPICIENLGVSRQHAYILGDKKEELFVLEDLKSLNGTYVNKKRVKKFLLKPNDVITIGQHTLEFLPENLPTLSQSTAPTGEEPYLLILETNQKIPLIKDILYFGNSSHDDIHVPGLMVGKNFASLNRKGESWVLQVLVKRFALFKVNGEDTQSAKLNSGDELEVAGVQFKFFMNA